MGRHGAAKSIKNILSFAGDALSTTGFTVHRLADRLGLAGLQGTNVERLDRGYRIRKGSSIGGV